MFRIDRSEREALYLEAIRSFDDISAALRLRDLARIRYLRPRFEAVARCLDDIGWRRHDSGLRSELTLPAEQLAVAMQHLADLATTLVERHAHDTNTPTARNEIDRHRAALQAAERLLKRTGPAPDRAPLVLADDAPPTRLKALTGDERDVLHHGAWFEFRGVPSLTAPIVMGAIS